MRFPSQVAVALMLGTAAPLALLAPAFAQTCACPPGEGVAVSGPVIQAPEPPPPLPQYDQPPMPEPGYNWTPGYWAWNNIDYYWVPGAWVEPPRVGVLWTPPYWGFVAGIFMFHPGYWGPHVGFYGGVDYGFGYGGAGYMGGRWEDGRFFYNRAVNNFGPTAVTNVYNQPITVNNTTINRVSYNGGPGGLQLRPTPEQEQIAAQPHVPATPAQRTQVRAASLDPAQFHSDNRGKPAVAATPRPGELKGPGAVPARAAGAAASLKGEEATPVKGEAKPEPKMERKALQETKPAGAEAPAGVEKPLKPGPKAEEKHPAEAAPAGKPKPTEAEKPVDREPRPMGGEKPHDAERPKAAEKAPAMEKPKTPEKPQGMEKPKAPEKTEGRMTSPAEAKPMMRAAHGEEPHPAAARAAAAEHGPKPEAKAHECGRPGQPACPR